jgi:hypothetical protein
MQALAARLEREFPLLQNAHDRWRARHGRTTRVIAGGLRPLYGLVAAARTSAHPTRGVFAHPDHPLRGRRSEGLLSGGGSRRYWQAIEPASSAIGSGTTPRPAPRSSRCGQSVWSAPAGHWRCPAAPFCAFRLAGALPMKPSFRRFVPQIRLFDPGGMNQPSTGGPSSRR